MKNIISDLFRDTENELGTHQFCILVLESLKNALLQYHIKSGDKFVDQFIKIFDLIKNTNPKYAILIDSFYKFLEYYEEKGKNKSVDDLIKEIERIKVSYKLESKLLVDVAKDIDIEGKNILVYDYSNSVHRVLKSFVKNNKKFQIIIAEQGLEKTEDNIVFFHKLGLPYKVVPFYMLPHIGNTIDMVFTGAVTFQSDYQFVMDPGSKAIISHFYLEKKPVYVFLTTSNFSLWPINKKEYNFYSNKHKRKRYGLDEIEFERVKFSHDRIPIDLISYVVTDKCIYTPKHLRKFFKQIFKKRLESDKKYSS